eukprot:scaffold1281_cov265-Prasinococcus_capsulatus_cf.AAC.3
MPRSCGNIPHYGRRTRRCCWGCARATTCAARRWRSPRAACGACCVRRRRRRRRHSPRSSARGARRPWRRCSSARATSAPRAWRGSIASTTPRRALGCVPALRQEVWASTAVARTGAVGLHCGRPPPSHLTCTNSSARDRGKGTSTSILVLVCSWWRSGSGCELSSPSW